MSTRWVCIVLLFIAAASTLYANAQDATPTTTAPILSAPDTGPVPVPEPSELAVQYYKSGNVIWVLLNLWNFLLAGVILFTGFSARMRDWATRAGKFWFFIIGTYFAIYVVLTGIIELPLSYYLGYVRQHAYGLSNQTFLKWLKDYSISTLVTVIAGYLLLWIPYVLLKKSPKRWWLYTSAVSIPIIFMAMLIVPVFVAPLYNEFGPMKDKVLEQQILDLAAKAGIEGGRVYEVEKSVDTNAINAYVTGFANTKRIVLWDTLLQKMTPDEVLFVMGHEMGHYVLGHIVRSIFIASLGTFISLFIVDRLARWMIARYGNQFGFTELSDVASFPLILLLFSFVSLVSAPIANGYSRYQEHASDQFGLEITHNNHAAATAFIKLQQENLAVPRPGMLYKLWRASHPPLGERIDFANEYRPWEKGQQGIYEHHFKE